MKCGNMRVADLKSLTKERRLRGYSGMREAELTELLRNNPPPAPQPDPQPGPPAPIMRPTSRPHPRHPTRPCPPPPSQALRSLRFRPDRPRQPELLRELEERNPQLVGPRQPQHPPAMQLVRLRQAPALKQYQLKPKRDQETFIESPVEHIEVPPASNAKQIKQMKKAKQAKQEN